MDFRIVSVFKQDHRDVRIYKHLDKTFGKADRADDDPITAAAYDLSYKFFRIPVGTQRHHIPLVISAFVQLTDQQAEMFRYDLISNKNDVIAAFSFQCAGNAVRAVIQLLDRLLDTNPFVLSNISVIIYHIGHDRLAYPRQLRHIFPGGSHKLRIHILSPAFLYAYQLFPFTLYHGFTRSTKLF